MTLGALLGIKLQYSNDDLIAHNKYVSGKRSVALSLNRCHKLFPVFSLLCPVGAFPSYQAVLLINRQDYRRASLARRRLTQAGLLWERNQSHSGLWETLQIS